MVDYSKWNDVVDDDDDDVRAQEEEEEDGAMREEILDRVKDGLLGKFVSIQKHSDGRPCNIEQHEHIMRMLESEPGLLEQVDVLCRIAQERFEEHDNRLGLIFLEAVNTLEACRRYGALELYSSICTPKDDYEKALREEYAKQTFGKLRLKRFMYQKLTEKDPSLSKILEENEARELASLHPTTSQQQKVSGDETRFFLLKKIPALLTSACLLLIFVKLFFFFFS